MTFEKFYNYKVFIDGTIENSTGHIMKPVIKKSGLIEYSLICEGENRSYYANSLLYFLFIETFDIDDTTNCVIHIDGDYNNLSLDNLLLISATGSSDFTKKKTLMDRLEVETQELEAKKHKGKEEPEIIIDGQYKLYMGYRFYEDGTVVNKKGKILTPRNKNGRLEIKLSRDGERKTFMFGRILYYLFIEEFDLNNNLLCVIHKNGNTMDISLDNLQLVNRARVIQGEGNKSITKLTDEQVRFIRANCQKEPSKNQFDKTGYSYADLAKMFGVTKGAIRLIVKNKCRYEDGYKLKQPT